MQYSSITLEWNEDDLQDLVAASCVLAEAEAQKTDSDMVEHEVCDPLHGDVHYAPGPGFQTPRPGRLPFS